MFWTSTRTRFPSLCVEILVNMPMILEYMLLIMCIALCFCWCACVSDIEFLRIWETRVILTPPPLPPTFLDCVTPTFKVHILYDLRLWVSQHVFWSHFLLIFMCFQADVSEKLWQTCHFLNLSTPPLPRQVLCYANSDMPVYDVRFLWFWTCSWHFHSAHSHVVPSSFFWELGRNISLF